MPNRSSQWAELLSPQLSEAFYIGFSDDGRRSSLIPSLFGVRNSQRAFEEHLGVGVLSSQGWNFEDSGRVQYDERNKGYVARLTHKEFSKGHIVQRKLIDDNLTQIAFDDAGALGDSAFRQREKSAANVFANAFSTGTDVDGFSNVGPDAVCLCSGSHPRSADDSTTQSNAGSSVLSKDAVSTTRITMQRITDDRGDLMDVMPDQLLIPPELEDTAATITRSTLDPNSANNAVNPQNGRFSTLVWHYLTDATNWFMLDSGRVRRSILWYERIPVEYSKTFDAETQQVRGSAYMRYSRGWRDWSGIHGHVQ
jgi:Mu-like prophage major head subunit gpT.